LVRLENAAAKQIKKRVYVNVARPRFFATEVC